MGALGSSILASARLPTMDCSASPLSNNGLWCLACLLFPESGSEGFYFSGLGGVGVGTERQIGGNRGSIRGASGEHRGRNRHNGIRWGRWPDSLISGVVGEALEEGSWCLGEGGLWGLGELHLEPIMANLGATLAHLGSILR